MRTPEQIQNLRLVMQLSFGPIVSLMPDEDVNQWADHIQAMVNNTPLPTWEIRVMLVGQEREWEYVIPETTRPTCSFDTITTKAKSLLDKYPKILAIRIVPEDPESSPFIFRRDSLFA